MRAYRTSREGVGEERKEVEVGREMTEIEWIPIQANSFDV